MRLCFDSGILLLCCFWLWLCSNGLHLLYVLVLLVYSMVVLSFWVLSSLILEFTIFAIWIRSLVGYGDPCLIN